MTKYIITLLTSFFALPILFAFFSAMVLQSCGEKPHSESKYVVMYRNNLPDFSSYLYCDSATLKTPYHVVAYDKGLKIEIMSTNPISIESNDNYKP